MRRYIYIYIRFSNDIFLLQKIYAQLDEPDGVSGILATQDQNPTLQQLVLAHEVSGQLQVALKDSTNLYSEVQILLYY